MQLHRMHCEYIAAYGKDHLAPLVDWPGVQHPFDANIAHTKQKQVDVDDVDQQKN